MLGFLLAAALPVLSWHGVVAKVASEFSLDAGYLITGWSAFVLIAAGLLLFLPVLWSIGRNPDSRFYPRSRNALAGWGVSLYLLGMALAVQVSQIANALNVQ